MPGYRLRDTILTNSHCEEIKKVEYCVSQTNLIKQNKLKDMNTRLPDTSSHQRSHLQSNHETWDCSGEQNTTVTLRKQQQRAQSSLTFATVGSKPIMSTHI